MRKLSIIIPVFLIFFGAQAFAIEDITWFPMDKGRIWAYDDGNADQITSFLKVERGGTAVQLFVFEPYNFFKRSFYRDGLKIYEFRSNFRRLWYDFGAKPGDTWKMTWTAVGAATATSAAPPEEIADINDGAEVTLVAIDEAVSVPYGDFKGVYHLKIIRPRVKDAAYVEEWFAPGIGCIQRVRDTIAGPHMQKLAKIAKPEEDSPLSLNVSLDKDSYAYGEDVKITVSLLNRSDKEVTLEFPTSFQMDYFIDGAYQWSKGRSFTEALTKVTVPAHDVFTWTLTHTSKDYFIPSGRHYVSVLVMGYPLKAARPFIVGPENPFLPGGIVLSVKTSKDRYNQGDPITFTLTVTNTSKAEVKLGILTGTPVKYWIDYQPAPGPVESKAPTEEKTIKPGESLPPFEVVYTADDRMLEPGGHALFAGLNGYEDIACTKFIITREVTLGKVTGLVYNGGESTEKSLVPIPGADMSLSTVIPKSFEAELSTMPRADTIGFTAKTDDKGVFLIEGVPVGAFYTLTVKKEGFSPYIETVRTLTEVTEVKVALKPVRIISEKELNFKRHVIAGLLITLGTDKGVYKPDSPFKAVFSIKNTLDKEVTFTFTSENYVDWYLDTPEGTVQLTADEVKKIGADAEFTMTLASGGSREFTRTATFKDRVPDQGGKCSIRASLRYTTCSITSLKQGDVSDYVNVIVTPVESVRIFARGYNKEMVIDLKTTTKTLINITTKTDGVTGEVAVTEIMENPHKPKLNGRFIKMIEVDADAAIRDGMESAVIRVYFTPADFGKDFNPRNLILSHWDDTLENPEWEDLDTRVDTVNNFAEATTKSFSSFGLFDTGTGTGVDETDEPLSFRLDQNTPNPFNPATTIHFQVPAAGHVTLTIYNIAGQEVARLLDGTLPAGVHQIVFDGSRYASGVYFYRLTGAGFTQARKMLLIK